MKPAEIMKVIRQLHQKLMKFAGEGQRTCEAEAIHIFRVNFKKLRAFIRLLNCSSSKNADLKIPGDLKNCYRQLGIMRDWQLLSAKLLLHPYAYHLNAAIAEINDHISDQHRVISDLPVEEIVMSSKKHFVKHSVKSVDLVAMELFLDDKWKQIRSIIANPYLTDSDIHRCRKTFKDIYYTIGMIRAEDVPLYANGFWPGNDEALFVSLMKDLGNFNDLCIAIKLIDSLESVDQPVLRWISDEWTNQKEIWFLDIAGRIRASLSNDVSFTK